MLATTFPAGSLHAVFASDMQRALQTAAPLVQMSGAKLTVDRRLRERSFGEWEGRPFKEIRLETPGHDLAALYEFKAPGGESFADVWARIDSFACDLVDVLASAGREKPGVAVVTHGGACALLLARLLRADFAASRAFRFANSGIVEFECRADGTLILLRYNDVSHLGEA